MDCIYVQYMRICDHGKVNPCKEVYTVNYFIDFNNT